MNNHFLTLPNLISVSRLSLALLLPFFKLFSLPFIIIYLLCISSDFLDGYLARKTNSCTQLGAILDSIADFIFFIVLIFIFSPLIIERPWLLTAVITVAIIRLLSLLIGYLKYKKLAFLHTNLNKATGFIIYLIPLLYYIFNNEIILVITILFALISSFEELIINLTSKELNRNIKSYNR